MRVDIKAFANSRSLRESYFHFANVQKAVSFVKSFSVDACLSRTTDSSKTLPDRTGNSSDTYLYPRNLKQHVCTGFERGACGYHVVNQEYVSVDHVLMVF